MQNDESHQPSLRRSALEVIRSGDGHTNMLAMPRAFVTLTGDTDSALLLSQLLYWAERGTHPEGWVYKSRDEWADELGINRYRLDKARRTLRRLGLIEESYHLARNRRLLHARPLEQQLTLRLRNLCGGASHEVRTQRVPSEQSVAKRQSAPAGSDRGGRRTETTVAPKPERSDYAPSRIRDCDSRKSGLSNHVTSSTETTEATTVETSSQIPAVDIGGARERHSLVQRMGSTASERSVPAASDTEERLLELLRVVDGFSGPGAVSRLRRVIADYPGLDYNREFGKFVEYWRGERVRRPWLMLRRWLERASRPARRQVQSNSNRDKPFVVTQDALGFCSVRFTH